MPYETMSQGVCPCGIRECEDRPFHLQWYSKTWDNSTLRWRSSPNVRHRRRFWRKLEAHDRKLDADRRYWLDACVRTWVAFIQHAVSLPRVQRARQVMKQSFATWMDFVERQNAARRELEEFKICVNVAVDAFLQGEDLVGEDSEEPMQ